MRREPSAELWERTDTPQRRHGRNNVSRRKETQAVGKGPPCKAKAKAKVVSISSAAQGSSV